MENKNFDKLIKSKLEGLENISQTSDWDMFLSKYKTELEDTSEFFDRTIQEKLDGLEVPYNKKHWYLMKESLEKEEFIRTSIYFSKIVEAGCVFLILFTFLNLFPTLSEKTELQRTIQDKQLIADIKNNDDTQLLESTIETSNKKQNIFNSSSSAPVSKSGSSNTYLSIADNTNFKKVKNSFSDDLLNEKSNNIKINEKFNSRGLIKKASPEFIAYSSDGSTKKQIEGHTDPNSASIFPMFERATIANVASLGVSQIIPLELQRSFYAAILPVLNRNNSKKEKFLSLSFAPTVNIVNSPFDYINKTQPYNTDALGGELGFNYSVRKNNLEIETGLNYGRKSYQPKQVDEIIGSFITSFRRLRLRQITYDVMSIPMNIKYHFSGNDNWSFYALTGTSLNGIANSDYLVEENGSKISIYDVQTNYRESNTAKKSYNPGILEGGNVLDNLYFTLDLAIGIERKFNKNTSFFIAPTLRQHLGLAGVGPNNDKVNSLGLNLGIKTRL